MSVFMIGIGFEYWSILSVVMDVKQLALIYTIGQTSCIGVMIFRIVKIQKTHLHWVVYKKI